MDWYRRYKAWSSKPADKSDYTFMLIIIGIWTASLFLATP